MAGDELLVPGEDRWAPKNDIMTPRKNSVDHPEYLRFGILGENSVLRGSCMKTRLLHGTGIYLSEWGRLVPVSHIPRNFSQVDTEHDI